MQKLKGQLSLFDLWSLGVASLIGAGIFVLTGVAAGLAGPALFLSFLIAGAVACLTSLSFAELAAMFPNAGASYVYCREAFRAIHPALGRFIGTVVGWTLMTQYMIIGSAVWLGFGLYAKYVYAGFSSTTWAVLLGLCTTALLSLGMKLSKHVINILVFVKVFALALFIVLGFAFAKFPQPLSQNPFMPFGLAGVIAGAAIVAFGQTHIDAICTLAEEARHPHRDIPRATLLAIATVVIFYTLVGWVSVRVVAWHVLPTLNAPLATAIQEALARVSFGHGLAPAFIAAAGIAATATAGMGCLIGAPRVGLAMARDGALPTFFAEIHSRFGSPAKGTLLLGFVATMVTLWGDIREVASAGVFAALLVFVFVNLSVIILRVKRGDAARPFKIPYSLGRVPIFTLLAVAGVVGEICYLKPKAILIGVAWLFTGVVVYFLRRPAIHERETK